MLSPFHNYGTEKLSMRAFHQDAWGIELGVSFSACLLFVVFFRVQYSWYFPSVAAWLTYSLCIVLTHLNLPAEYADIFVLWNVLIAALSFVAAHRQETFTRLIWLSSYTLYLESLHSPPVSPNKPESSHSSVPEFFTMNRVSETRTSYSCSQFLLRLFSPLGLCFNPFTLPVSQASGVLSEMAWLHPSIANTSEDMDLSHLRNPNCVNPRSSVGAKQPFLPTLQALENILHTPFAKLSTEEEKKLLRITEALYYRNHRTNPPWYASFPCCRRHPPAAVHPAPPESSRTQTRSYTETDRVFCPENGGVLDPTVRASVVEDLDEVTKNWVAAELQGKRAKFTKNKNLTTLSTMNTSVKSTATLSGSGNNLHMFTASLPKRTLSISRGLRDPRAGMSPSSRDGPALYRTGSIASGNSLFNSSRSPSEHHVPADETPSRADGPPSSDSSVAQSTPVKSPSALNANSSFPSRKNSPLPTAASPGGSSANFYLNPNALGFDPARFRDAQIHASENQCLSSVARVRGYQAHHAAGGRPHRYRQNSSGEIDNIDSETEQLMHDIVVDDTLEAGQEFGTEITNRLQVVTDWNFNVFDFDSHTNGRPLAYIAYELFDRFRLFDLSSPIYLAEDLFLPFIDVIEREYCFDVNNPNPYHTNIHAADVAQAIASMMLTPRLAALLDHSDALSLLLAAIVHDFRHPGVNNTYLIKTNDPLAIRYNDESVLENFHVSEAFGVLLQPEYNILSTLSPEAYRSVRSIIIKLVLATDLSQGARYTNGLRDRLHVENLGSEDPDKLLIMQMMIKCADVAHPSRPLHVHEEWSNRVTEEFYRQGDIERKKGLPISPLCDRSQHNLAKSQIGFIEFVVKPAFAVLTDYTRYNLWMDGLMSNLDHWKNLANANNPPAANARALPPSSSNGANSGSNPTKQEETVIQVNGSDAQKNPSRQNDARNNKDTTAVRGSRVLQSISSVFTRGDKSSSASGEAVGKKAHNLSFADVNSDHHHTDITFVEETNIPAKQDHKRRGPGPFREGKEREVERKSKRESKHDN